MKYRPASVAAARIGKRMASVGERFSIFCTGSLSSSESLSSDCFLAFFSFLAAEEGRVREAWAAMNIGKIAEARR